MSETPNYDLEERHPEKAGSKSRQGRDTNEITVQGGILNWICKSSDIGASKTIRTEILFPCQPPDKGVEQVLRVLKRFERASSKDQEEDDEDADSNQSSSLNTVLQPFDEKPGKEICLTVYVCIQAKVLILHWS
ncbi:hypothetical protein VNO77_34870 [Canavalia gladiata]|uniref:Uncharacterized protein n=1 Tax=Canavalia gladiata TaxID=3824 RepID=A0AAN9KFY8_CANGL